jgi:hypothetical protein
MRHRMWGGLMGRGIRSGISKSRSARSRTAGACPTSLEGLSAGKERLWRWVALVCFPKDNHRAKTGISRYHEIVADGVDSVPAESPARRAAKSTNRVQNFVPPTCKILDSRIVQTAGTTKSEKRDKAHYRNGAFTSMQALPAVYQIMTKDSVSVNHGFEKSWRHDFVGGLTNFSATNLRAWPYRK